MSSRGKTERRFRATVVVAAIGILLGLAVAPAQVSRGDISEPVVIADQL